MQAFFDLLDARVIPEGFDPDREPERNRFEEDWGKPTSERQLDLIEEARALAERISG